MYGTKTSSIRELYGNFTPVSNEAGFLGQGLLNIVAPKAAQRIADQKAAKKEAKQQMKLERIEARGNARANVAAAGGGLAGLGSAINGVLGNLFGGGGSDAGIDYGNGGSEPEKSNTGLIIGIVAAVVVFGVVLFIALKEKKK